MSATTDPLQPALAAALLRFAPTSEVTDALLPVANLGRDGIPLGAAPSTQLARALTGRGVAYTRSIAETPGTDPALLDQLARVPQVSVRRAVAANPSTSIATLEYLATWASRPGRSDIATLLALALTIPPPQWLPRVSAIVAAGELNVPARDLAVNAAAQLARRADPALVWQTLQISDRRTQAVLAAAAADGDLPVTLADLLDRTPPELRPVLLNAVVNHAFEKDVHLDTRTVEHLVKHRLDSYGVHRARFRYDHNAVTALLATDDPDLGYAVLLAVATGRAELTDEQVHTLVAGSTGTEHAGYILSHQPLRDRLTPAELNRLAPHLPTSWRYIRSLLYARGTEMSPTSRVQVLRCGSRTVTSVWLTGQVGVAPTAAEVEMLAADPGGSLSGETGYRAWPPISARSVPDYIRSFASDFTAAVYGNPGVADVLNAAGPTTVALAAQPVDGEPNAFLLFLADRVKDRLGTNGQAWHLLTGIAHRVPTGTVDDLLDLVAGMVTGPESGRTTA